MEGKRRKGRLRFWLAVIAVLVGLVVYNYWPIGPTKVVISRETTYIDGPLNADGTPDYVRYLDDKYSAGVTPDNNAAPLLLRALGPQLLPQGWWDDSGGTLDLDEPAEEALRRLGLASDVFERDNRFVPWENRVVPPAGDGNAASAPAAAAAADANSPMTAAVADDEDDEDDEGDEGSDWFSEKSYDGPRLYEVLEDLTRDGKVHPDLEAWLAANAGPLELIRRASQRERLYLPLISNLIPPTVLGVGLPNITLLRDCVNALRARAVLRMKRGDAAGAWEDVLTAHRLARLLGQAPIFMQYLSGVRVDGAAAATGQLLASRWHKETAVHSGEIIAKLSALRAFPRIEEVLNDCERLVGLDAAVYTSRQASLAVNASSLKAGGFLDTNAMLRDMNRWYDRAFKFINVPRGPARAQVFQDFDKQITEFSAYRANNAWWQRPLKHGGRLTRGAVTRAVSGQLVTLLIPALGQTPDTVDGARMMCDLELLAVALACWRAEHGRWPAELSELSPALLKEIPQDPFSGGPLIYKPGDDGYLLYSVGRNQRDDGGPIDSADSDSVDREQYDDFGAKVKSADG